MQKQARHGADCRGGLNVGQAIEPDKKALNGLVSGAAESLLAVYNGERRGDTAATVRYARKLGRRIIILNPASLEVIEE